MEARKKKPKVEKKDTNPKDAVGTTKAPFSTVPSNIVMMLGLAMMEGARKYGRHNYRVSGVRASVYYDAFMRHMTAYWEGEDIDPDSGLPHPIKAMACLTILMDADQNGMLTDDRPPKVKNKNWMKELNQYAKGIIEKYPDALPAYTHESVSS